jgi:hypothetical protein
VRGTGKEGPTSHGTNKRRSEREGAKEGGRAGGRTYLQVGHIAGGEGEEEGDDRAVVDPDGVKEGSEAAEVAGGRGGAEGEDQVFDDLKGGRDGGREGWGEGGLSLEVGEALSWHGRACS